ncbi:MAG: glycosyltransferase family 1 protein [Myxococcales bacterium]|nr:glycosyltransferase family 1 protein [Myxococcales bacterium]
MRLVKLTTVYPDYLAQFEARRPELRGRPYTEIAQALHDDAFGWADFWSGALAGLGHQSHELTINFESLQRAWAREHGFSPGPDWSFDIAAAQVRALDPDVLWYDHHEPRLLAKLREVLGRRPIIGWAGSSIPKTEAWGLMDLVLSCAPETVAALRSRGIRAAQLHHGFDPRILDRLGSTQKRHRVTFIGQLREGQAYHEGRRRLLSELALQVPLEIYTPTPSPRGAAVELAKRGLYWLLQAARSAGVPDRIIGRMPLLRGAAAWDSPPSHRIPERLSSSIRPAVYGMEMFRVTAGSTLALNAHADSSSTHASNMRLFEVTGVGTCLVTDWRENLPELFEPDREVVAYRTSDECARKIRWLLESPEERRKIAAAGQDRCLRDHTYAARARELVRLIRELSVPEHSGSAS